jgi:predicted GNAT family acetyltransferase
MAMAMLYSLARNVSTDRNLSAARPFGRHGHPVGIEMKLRDLRDNAARSRYEMDVEGQTVFANYRREGDVLALLWVEAPPPLRGTGAAGWLMTLIGEEARRQNWKIVPICGYAAAWLRASKTYRDLVM